MAAMPTLFAPEALLPDGWARDVRVSLDGRPHRRGRGRIRARTRRHPARRPGAAAGDAQPAQPHLPAGDGRDDRAPRAGRGHLLDLAQPDVPLPRRARPRGCRGDRRADLRRDARGRATRRSPSSTTCTTSPAARPMPTPAELSYRIVQAAADAGIGLTLLPVLYSYGGAGAQPLAGGQRRFGNGLDGFLRLREDAAAALSGDAVIGAAPHSLRATTPDQIAALVAALPEGPLHIHAAEQVEEVAQVTGWLGARPVEFLLDAIGIGPRWCLIHATQMTAGRGRPPRPLGCGRRPLPDHRGQPRRRHLPGHRLSRGRRRLRHRRRFQRSGRRSPRSCAASSTASA